jgi:hypothetical protein
LAFPRTVTIGGSQIRFKLGDLAMVLPKPASQARGVEPFEIGLVHYTVEGVHGQQVTCLFDGWKPRTFREFRLLLIQTWINNPGEVKVLPNDNWRYKSPFHLESF